ncbi:hypothetical protein EHQ42_10635, partial [Leptospira levettii]|uniref:hypothetical protein n=1 Tax=Leptospira levettii TaxID=2023178 RepID=UPI0010837D95
MNKILSDFLNNLSSLIRFSLPGFVSIALLYGSIPDFIEKHNFDFKSILLIGIVIGTTAHIIHRNSWFVFFESWYFLTPLTPVSNFNDKCHHIAKGWSGFAIVRYSNSFAQSNLAGYLGHRWSLAHSSAVIAELTIGCTLFAQCNSILNKYYCLFLILGTSLFIISVLNMMILYKVEKHIV